MSTTKMRVKVYSFEHKILEEAVKKIVQVVLKAGGKVVGPIPMKTKKKKVTIRRSTFVFSKHADTLECRTHIRLLDINNVTGEIVNSLSNMSLPAGIDISIETINI